MYEIRCVQGNSCCFATLLLCNMAGFKLHIHLRLQWWHFSTDRHILMRLTTDGFALGIGIGYTRHLQNITTVITTASMSDVLQDHAESVAHRSRYLLPASNGERPFLLCSPAFANSFSLLTTATLNWLKNNWARVRVRVSGTSRLAVRLDECARDVNPCSHNPYVASPQERMGLSLLTRHGLFKCT
jgi:hypothetical protein